MYLGVDIGGTFTDLVLMDDEGPSDGEIANYGWRSRDRSVRRHRADGRGEGAKRSGSAPTGRGFRPRARPRRPTRLSNGPAR